MQELAGGVQMEGGMEEGVGALMAAGQPEAPPMGAAPMGPPPMGPPPMGPGPDPTALGPTLNGTPQGFAVGGAVTRFRNSPVVQNFATGGAGKAKTLADYARVSPEALTGNVQSLYEERLPLYEKVAARDPAADKAAFWAQMAQLGLNLAAPPPELRGRSPAEALAAAAKVPFANIAQLGAKAAEGKRAARIGALQAAETAQTAQQAARYKREEQKATQAFRSTVLRTQMSFDQKEGETARNWKERLAADDRQLQRDLRATTELGLDQRQQAQAEINEKLEKNRQQYKLAQIAAGHENAQEILGLKTNAQMKQLKLSRQTTTLEAEQLKLAEQRLQFDRDRQADNFGLKTQAQNALESIRGQELGLKRDELESIDQHRTRMSEQKAKDSELLEKHREAIVSGNTADRKQLLEIERERMKLRGATQQDLNNFNDAMMQHRADVLAVDKTYKEQLAAAKTAAAGLNAFGKGLTGRILGMFSDAPVLSAYADGTLDRLNPSKVLEINNAVTYWQQRKFGQSEELGRPIWLPGNELTDYMKQIINDRADMIEARKKANDKNANSMVVPGIGVEDADGNLQAVDKPATIIRDGETPARPPPTVVTGRDQPRDLGLPAGVVLSPEHKAGAKTILESMRQGAEDVEGTDPEAATGATKALPVMLNWLSSSFFDVGGTGNWVPFSRTTEATAMLNRLNTTTKLVVKQFGSRTAYAELTDVAKGLMVEPSVFTTDDQAAASYKQLGIWLGQQMDIAQDVVDNPSSYRQAGVVSRAKKSLPMLASLKGSYDKLAKMVGAGTTGVPTGDVDKAVERKRRYIWVDGKKTENPNWEGD